MSIVLILISYHLSFAQNGVAPDAPNVFVDCYAWCHQQYVRQELTYVNYMRDRQTADVFVQITNQQTGGGARKYFLEFVGQGRFEGIQDTVEYFTEPNASQNDQRNWMLENMKKGLLPYLIRTSVYDKIAYDVLGKAPGVDVNQEFDDPWNLWTFAVRGNVSLNGQEGIRRTNINSRINVGKVTENFKWTSRMFMNYSSNYFVLDENETVRNRVTNTGFSSTYVKSITGHFSAGVFGSILENSFSNYDLSWSLQPAFELNMYPYMEANKRQLTALYRIGPQFNNYVDTTIFDVADELLWRHSIEFNFSKIEDWGSVDFEIEYGNYLHDWQLLYARINPDLDLNIVKGLFFNIGGFFSWTRNQVNIPKEDASIDDVLLQIRQLKSNYNYGMYMGINYRFGSNYNNIVNVRF